MCFHNGLAIVEKSTAQAEAVAVFAFQNKSNI